MGPLKTLGPDDYNAHFFQMNWEMVGESLSRMVKEAFEIREVRKK